MKFLASFVLLATAAYALAQTGSPAPVPRYQVKRASSPIAIDGKPDEPAWAAADKIELSFPWPQMAGSREKTIVRLLWDDRYLYVAFQCDDADILATETRRDSPVDRDDSVQLLINPDPTQSHAYIGLEVNVLGTIHDYLGANGEYFFQQFNLQDVRLMTFVDGTVNQHNDEDRGWSLEAAIPWSDFDDLSRQHTAGTVWKANFGRWSGAAPHRSYSIWSDSLLKEPSGHNPQRFGELVFAQ
jgi:Carbohydrate-binding family 9